MAIDVGPGAGDWGSVLTTRTYIDEDNPANATGTIDYVQTWFSGTGTAFEAAAFTNEGGTDFSTNGTSGALGNPADGENEYNAPGDFTAFAITSGDYIGCYFSAGSIEAQTGTLWYTTSDDIPASSVTFTYYGTYEVALYATGVESGGTTEIITGGTVALASGGATELWANLLVIPTSVTLTKTGGGFWGNLTSTITSGTNTLTGSSFWGNIASKISSGTLTITGAAFSELGAVIKAIAGGALTLTGKAFNNILTVKIAKVTAVLTGSNLFGNITSKMGAGALAVVGVLKLVQTVILTGALTLTGKAFWGNLLSVIGSSALTLAGTIGHFFTNIISSGALTITSSTVNFIRAINLEVGALTLTGKNFISNVAGVGGRMLRRFFDFF